MLAGEPPDGLRDVPVVPLEARLSEALERFAGDDPAGRAARRRPEGATRLASVIEDLTGRPLARLIA